ncbi:MAG: hypothetical protein PHX87_04850 [Candidatus Peribacteraceae bacterium]|nr:hypothetical protein [Candidatus Peribacteraceae bacterium]MDD5742724.1 hypothetical protein [Candidatus Peribacteraceae bacterium]
MISLSTSIVLLLSVAAPVMAMVDTSAVANRISRRLLEEKTRADQRVPVGEVETMLRLSERKQAMPESSGLTNLGRARITTRIHTLRGARTPAARGERPSRRSIINNAESMLVLPPSLVQTGDSQTTSQRISRRTLINLTEIVNRVQVGQ